MQSKLRTRSCQQSVLSKTHPGCGGGLEGVKNAGDAGRSSLTSPALTRISHRLTAEARGENSALRAVG